MTRAREIVALALVVAAAATALPQAGWNAAAHFSLVEALADGTPRIDDHLNQSGDIAWIDGHFYAAKSPGLAVISLPLYLVLDALDAFPPKQKSTSGPPGAQAVPERAIWRINWVVLTSFFVLLLLVRWAVDRVYRGAGVVVAVMLGLGTMLLPFAAAYFAHVPSTMLGFAAFAVLLHERTRGSPLLLVAAGVLAGLAIFVELPLAVVAVCLGAYAAVERPRTRRALAYGGGLLIGVLPLLAYNTWAFGSPFRNGYSNAVLYLGTTGHDVIGANDIGFFGLTHPRVGVLLDLLFSQRGLFVLMPVTLAAVVGLPLLARRARREAVLIGLVVAAVLLYNAAYYLPFGGGSPGPRFLVPILPFLGLPLAAVLLRWPLVVLATFAVSAFWMISATTAGPLLAEDVSPASWIGDIVDEHELANSVFLNGRSAVLLLVAVALAAVALATPSFVTIARRARARES